MKSTLMLITLALAFFSFAALGESDTTKAKEETKQAWSNTKKLVRKKTRAAKDETCHLVNGKMECAAKKLKHNAENLGDELKN